MRVDNILSCTLVPLRIIPDVPEKGIRAKNLAVHIREVPGNGAGEAHIALAFDDFQKLMKYLTIFLDLGNDIVKLSRIFVVGPVIEKVHQAIGHDVL